MFGITPSAVFTFAVAAVYLILATGVSCGGYGGFGDHGHDHYHISHHKVAHVSYIKKPVVSTHYVKKPVVSYISKPIKSIHYESKPILSYHSVPVITKGHGHYGHGW